MRQVGSVIGVAILGTLISNAYGSRVDTGRAARPPRPTSPGSSVAGGVEVAHQLGSAALLDSVRSAFVDGMDIMLWTCGGIARRLRPARGRLPAAKLRCRTRCDAESAGRSHN